MFNNFFSENLAVYEITSKTSVEPVRPQTIERMLVACGIINVTRAKAHACARAPTSKAIRAYAHTHKCVILIAFLRQQWFLTHTCQVFVLKIVRNA